MVYLGDMERDLGWKLLLQHVQASQRAVVVTRELDQEVMVVQRLKLDFGVGRLSDLVYLAVLLAADEVAMLVRELEREANLVVEALK